MRSAIGSAFALAAWLGSGPAAPAVASPVPGSGEGNAAGIAASPWREVPRSGFTLAFVDSAPDTAGIVAVVEDGRRRVERFFDAPFETTFTTRIFPSRGTLDAYWREAWKVPDLKTECWMVASGVATELDLLSPRVWKSEACEHDPADAREIRLLLTHELVHVYHGQRNPKPDFEGLDSIGWFPEGLATYASGQLDTLHAEAAAKALSEDKWPKDLESVWSGRYRYGLAGSLVAYIDRTRGRETIRKMLAGTSEEELLGLLGVTEAELLLRWRESVGAKPR